MGGGSSAHDVEFEDDRDGLDKPTRLSYYTRKGGFRSNIPAGEKCRLCFCDRDEDNEYAVEGICSCRGDSSAAHISCISNWGMAKFRSHGDLSGFYSCPTCKQTYHGAASLALAREALSAAYSATGLEVAIQRGVSQHDYCYKATLKVATTLQFQGQLIEAEELFEHCLEKGRALYGEVHPEFATLMNDMALLFMQQGKQRQAKTMLLHVIDMYKRTLERRPHDDLTAWPPDNDTMRTWLATAINNLGLLEQKQANFTSSRELFRESLALRRIVFGEKSEHPEIAQSLNNLGGVKYEERQYAEAELLYRESLGIYSKIFGSNHPLVAKTSYNLANTLYASGAVTSEIIDRCKAALHVLQKSYGHEHYLVECASEVLRKALKSKDKSKKKDGVNLRGSMPMTPISGLTLTKVKEPVQLPPS